MTRDLDAKRKKILRLVEEYSGKAFAAATFSPSQTLAPSAGKMIDAAEICMMVDSALDGWLTSGHFIVAFQSRLTSYVKVEKAITIKFGSSVNLVSMKPLFTPKLRYKRLLKGGEMINSTEVSLAAANLTAVGGLVSNFLDVNNATDNIDTTHLDAAVPPRTRANMFSYILSNSFDLTEVVRVTAKHSLFVIEDCCEGLGVPHGGQTVGNIGTVGLYSACHIAADENGALFTGHPLRKNIAEFILEWGLGNIWGKRFKWKSGNVSETYEHKYADSYTYIHIVSNLRIMDMRAVTALAQTDRDNEFVTACPGNFRFTEVGLAKFTDVLFVPERIPNSSASWFGFPITLSQSLKKTCHGFQSYLQEKTIGSRRLLAGNLLRRPYFRDIEHYVARKLTNAEIILNQIFWIGVYPGLTHKHLD